VDQLSGERPRELDLFTHTNQIELAQLFYLANHTLAPDHDAAMVTEGLLQVAETRSWAAAREQIILCHGWPLHLMARPVRLVHYTSDTEIRLPDGWISAVPSYIHECFDDVLGTASDKKYEHARLDQTLTWQKRWWRLSGYNDSFVLKLICEAWECEIGDILEPVEKRGWSDFADIGYQDIGPVPVFRLNRPARRT
jgi:hypothetical protein